MISAGDAPAGAHGEEGDVVVLALDIAGLPDTPRGLHASMIQASVTSHPRS
jgi:hypothetical protein